MNSTMILGFWWCWSEYYWETIEESGYGTAMKLENTGFGACNVRFPSCGGCWGEEGENVVNEDDLWTFENRWAIEDVILFSILVHFFWSWWVTSLSLFFARFCVVAFCLISILTSFRQKTRSDDRVRIFLYVTSLSSILQRWTSVFVVFVFWSCLSVRGVLGN